MLVSLLRPGGGASGGQREEVKVPLMGALLSYLLLCGAGSLDRLPGPVLQALLEGMYWQVLLGCTGLCHQNDVHCDCKSACWRMHACLGTPMRAAAVCPICV